MRMETRSRTTAVVELLQLGRQALEAHAGDHLGHAELGLRQVPRQAAAIEVGLLCDSSGHTILLSRSRFSQKA